MSEFQSDIERQYEAYCKIAEERGFIDLSAKKNGFRCTTKSNEFNAGWIAFTGAVSAMRDYQQSEIDQLKKQLNTANISKKGDDSTIENATKVMEEMRGQIQKLQKERDQLKAEKAGLEKLIKDWRKSANWMCATDDKHVINSLRSCADDLEKALRGDS